MASSEVEIISSCFLRDHNRGDRFIERNARAAMQKNLKDLVKSCISAPPRIPNPNRNHDNSNSCNADSSVQTRHKNSSNSYHKSSRENDRWAKAREMVFQSEISPSQSDSSVETRAVSSIVKRWKDFEAESKNLILSNAGNNTSSTAVNSSVCSSRSNSNSTFTENASILDVPNRNSLAASETVEERFDNQSTAEDAFMDWESDRTAPSGRASICSRDSNATEKERRRVADIIRKLTSVNGEECSEREQVVETTLSLPRVRTSLDHQPEMRGGGGAIMASPRIRGRQAFNDLLMQLERDRHKELQALGERKAVSKFSHRGRLQALLKVRSLRHELEVKNDEQINSAVSERNKNSKVSSIGHIRARFNTRAEHNQVDSCPRKEVSNNTQDAEKSNASNQQKEVVDHNHNVEHPSTSKQLKQESHPREVTNMINSNSDVKTCSSSNGSKICISHNPNKDFSCISNATKKETHHQEVTDPSSSFRAIVNDTLDGEMCSTSNRVKVDIKHEDVITATKLNTSPINNTEDSQTEANTTVGALWQMTSLEVNKFDSQESSQKKGKDKHVAAEHIVKKQQSLAHMSNNKQQSIASLYDWINDISASNPDWEDQETNKGNVVEPSLEWPSNVRQAPSECEEDQSSYQQQLEDQETYHQQLEEDQEQLEEDQENYQQTETYYDWISDIARPRSDWEDLRQERYQEMLDPFTDNGDIKQLLESKSVSSFLSSGLRDIIDQLMISRTQGHQNVIENQVEEHTEEVRVAGEEENEQHEQEEASTEHFVEIEEEDRSPMARQFCEVGEYFDQTPSSSMNSAAPSLIRSWSPNRNDDVSDDSPQSPSMQKFHSFKSFTQDNQQRSSSFKNQHPSIEMELIYDLRGHMEQLHQEISDLRKTIKSCMNMQVKMQCHMKHEPSSHSAARKKGESNNRSPRKGTCCLCYDSEVDSLLYRCGHMCACFKCAQELQWGSGKCPICRAPILDVVRTYTD